MNPSTRRAMRVRCLAGARDAVIAGEMNMATRKKKPATNKGGRPKFEITEKQWKMFETMCTAGVLKEWICDSIGTTEKTLTRMCQERYGIGFSEYSQQKRRAGRALLQTKQLELALKGDRTMLIWLGKQWLGQKENPVIDQHEGAKDVKITLNVNGQERVIATNTAEDGKATRH